MPRYRGLVLLAIPIVLILALLVARPDLVRNYPMVFLVMVAVGIVIGILLVVRRGPPPGR